jgi:ecotin
MKAFPQAEEGQKRYVIQLEKKDNENDFKVEIVIGKKVILDLQNHYFFAGQIEPINILGWGFTRYVLPDFGPMIATLMAVDPAAEKTERFIRLMGEPYLVRYNSRLPVVVYAPEGAEVNYRIWSAAKTLNRVTAD